MKDLIITYINERVKELESCWSEDSAPRIAELNDLKESIENLRL